MSRMLAAVQAAERGIAMGLDVCYALQTAARLHAVSEDHLTRFVLQKLIGVQRARRAVGWLAEGEVAAMRRRGPGRPRKVG